MPVIQGDPDVFNIVPKQFKVPPGKQKPGQLTDAQIEEFFTKGFIVVENFYTREELDACLTSIEGLVDELANKLHNAKKIKHLYEELGVYERLTAIEKEFPGANIILHKLGKLPESFRHLWAHDRILNVMEQLIGPDIAGHPVWNLRTKTPQCEAATVPWHQDNAYLDEAVMKDILVPTIWVPLLDCNVEHGCLEFMSGGHKSGRIGEHFCCAGNTWYVEMFEDEMRDNLGIDTKTAAVKVPVKYGSLVLFNNIIPHRSLDNFSSKVRWSLDLRYQDSKKPYGFHGLKDGVEFRRGGRNVDNIKWEEFNEVDRNVEQINAVKEELSGEGIVSDSQLDTTISGPWMKRWQIVHRNQHTRALEQSRDGTSWHRPY